MGELMRRYWQPVALSEELPEGGAPIPVKIMGEELVLYRDEQGKLGLLGIHCPHRGADLSYRQAGGLLAYGPDYPHADTMGSWPHTIDVIKGRNDLSPSAQDAILGGNALRLFDWQR